MQHEFLERVAILIPSYNPDKQLVQYVKGLQGTGFTNIIIVDDGSNDSSRVYFDEIERMTDDIVILHHAVNQGKGRALKTGMHYFLNVFSKQQMCGIVTADADGQHSVEDTAKVAKMLAETSGFVLGTRDFDEKNVPFKSRIGNKMTTTVMWLLYGRKIRDTQTGLRGIPYALVSDFLKLAGERFEYEILMLIDAIRKKIRIFEVSIETIYVDSNRATHFDAVKDSIRIYRVIFATFFSFALSGIASFLIDICLFSIFTKEIFDVFGVNTSVFLGTVLARIISSLFNYKINKDAVFQIENSTPNNMVRYYVLCGFQLLASWFLVVLVYSHLEFDTTIIKCAVDFCLFFISYQVQRIWVFKEKRA